MTALAAPPRDWRDLAACRDLDPELFFPAGDPSSPAAAERAAEALAACAACPVRRECLDFALRIRAADGIWGGTAEPGRQAPGTPAAPRASALCASGRHLKDGPGRCPGCTGEYGRKREKDRDRDYAAVYARRVARARAARELAA